MIAGETIGARLPTSESWVHFSYVHHGKYSMTTDMVDVTALPLMIASRVVRASALFFSVLRASALLLSMLGIARFLLSSAPF